MASEAVGPIETDDGNDEAKDQSLLNIDTESDSDDQDEEPEEFSSDRQTDKVIREGTALKDEGTALFKQQKWSAAIEKYREGFLAVPEDISGYREAVARDLRVACLNNVAMCQTKIEAWQEVLTTCSQTQSIDPKNAKAWYRSGVAYHKLNQWNEAKDDLKTALELEPKNKEVQKQLELCQKDEMATKKQKSGVNDYSRFDNLDCSDDEEEDTKDAEAAPAEEAPPKKAPKKKSTPPKRKPVKPKPDSDSDEVDGDEILSTKRGSDKKNSKYWWDSAGGSNASSTGVITPQKIDSAASVAAPAVAAGSSVWNAAGTWEERSMEDWFEAALRRHLVGLSFQDAATVNTLESFKGECSICKRRNKTSFIYEVSFKLKCDVEGESVTLVIDDLDSTNEPEEYEISVKWGKAKNRGALEGFVKPKASRGHDGLVPMVRGAIATVIEEYQQQ